MTNLTTITENDQMLHKIRNALKLYSDTENGISAPALAKKMGIHLTRPYPYLKYMALRGETIPIMRVIGKHHVTHYCKPKVNTKSYLESVRWSQGAATTKQFDDLVLDVALRKKEKNCWKAPETERAYFAEMLIVKTVLLDCGWVDGNALTQEIVKNFERKLKEHGCSESGIRTRVSRLRELYGLGRIPRRRRYDKKPPPTFAESYVPMPTPKSIPPLESVVEVHVAEPVLSQYGFIRRVFYATGRGLKSIWRVVW